jgi:hypothetical protein
MLLETALTQRADRVLHALVQVVLILSLTLSPNISLYVVNFSGFHRRAYSESRRITTVLARVNIPILSQIQYTSAHHTYLTFILVLSFKQHLSLPRGPVPSDLLHKSM